MAAVLSFHSLSAAAYPSVNKNWESFHRRNMSDIYRHRLPDSCVDFAAEEGKIMFTRSLTQGYANIYFKLASQFRTQEEITFCGVTTLVMVLNALEVDPGRVWKFPWRWYHESMLDCCGYLERLHQEGITFKTFTSLAVCNRLNVDASYFYKDSEENIAEFREKVIQSVRSDDTVAVASYDRATLKQMGEGHFSPIAAYDPDTDRVLVLDVARFKYPPHWIPLPLLCRAMTALDEETRLPRGYAIMRLDKNSIPLVLFKLSDAFVECNKELWNGVWKWLEWLEGPLEAHTPQSLAKDTIEVLSSFFRPNEICSERRRSSCCPIAKELDDIERQMEASMEQTCAVLCEEITSTETYKLLVNLGCPKSLTVLFLAWPYDMSGSQIAKELEGYMEQQTKGLSKETRNELNQLSLQIRVFLEKPPFDAKK